MGTAQDLLKDSQPNKNTLSKQKQALQTNQSVHKLKQSPQCCVIPGHLNRLIKLQPARYKLQYWKLLCHDNASPN